MLALGHVRRALEHHVLEQVREPGPAPLLVAAANVVPQVDGHDRRPSIGGQDHPQAVVQPEALNRNVGHGGSLAGAELRTKRAPGEPVHGGGSGRW